MATASRVNLRTPEVMEHVQAQVERHYASALVEEARVGGGILRRDDLEIHLAKEFGFCYGVERAIDLAYAASKVFQGRRLFILGEIIHNPDVNDQIAALGIQVIPNTPQEPPDLSGLTAEDVMIFPAFGADARVVEAVKKIGCHIVDTTCGDVMSVWKRVRQNARENVTSIIHGKSSHEETRATASRALGDGEGHYLVVLNLEQASRVCDFMIHGGDPVAFLHEFSGAYSEGFDPTRHLQRVGVANQTTMLRSETEEVQRLLREAVRTRDGNEANFRFFDTICGATQDRQDALFGLLRRPLDLLLVVGGYNSSNTAHLVEIGERRVPTYFIRDQHRLLSNQEIRHFSLTRQEEILTAHWLPGGFVRVGITAGASCPNNLIEEVITRLIFLAQAGREE